MKLSMAKILRSALPLASLLLAACGGSSGGDSAPASPPATAAATLTLGVATATAGVTIINQTVATTDTDGGSNPYQVFPGQANYWDIDRDFSLSDGYDDQFDGALNVSVSVDAGSTFASFPYDQQKSELTWYTPQVGSADGLKGVAVADASYQTPVNGSKSAYITTATADTRLQQTLNLTAATGTVTLTWGGSLRTGSANITQADPSDFKVVLRDANGLLLATLYDYNLDGNWGSADITAYAGQTVQLSFEATGDWGSNATQIDDVSVVDGISAEHVVNGGFEADLTGWTTNVVNTSTNFTSGVRTLNGLDVQRSFYTIPNKSWGRWVDVYKNNTASPIIATIQYYSNFGSDGAGIVYNTPNTSGKSITSWDGSASDRDFGMVYGTANNVSYTSATALNAYNSGSGDITVSYNVTVPAGGQVAIVNFIVMDGTDTGLAADINAKATEIDNAAAAIVANFKTDVQYRNGMTQAQIDSIINF